MGSDGAYTVGSCDGLICQAHSFYRDPFLFDIIHIWNPLTRKVLVLPPCPATISDDFQFDDQSCFIGFGFCPESNDYKVVNLKYFEAGAAAAGRSKLEVYSVKKNSWEKKITAATPLPLPHRGWRGGRGTVINGACHWLGTLEQDQLIILSYKFGEEVVQETKVPANLEYYGIRGHGIREYEGSVSLISEDEGEFNVWVMKEFGVAESWVKHITVQLPPLRAPLLGARRNIAERYDQVIGFINNGQQVLLVATRILRFSHSRVIICYDATKAEKTEEHGISYDHEKFQTEVISNFKQSLISLPGEISYSTPRE